MKKVIKKPTKKRVKKPSLPKLMKKADKVFSEWIRNRDNHQCVVCGSTYIVQNGHLIARGKKATRFDEKNCNAQCSSCNYKHNFEPQHYTSWFIKKYGEQEYLNLVELSKTIKKFNRYELEELIEKYS